MTSTSEDAADDLVRELAWVRRLARRLVGDDGDDLSQDVAAIALARPPRSGLRAWLGAVTRRRAARWHRDRRRRAEVEVSGAAEVLAADGADVADRIAWQRELTDAVDSLPEPYRGVVVARFFDGLAPAEIARRRGVPAATVRQQVRRALAMLRARLDSRRGGEWRASLVAVAWPATARAAWILGASWMAKQAWAAAAVVVLAIAVAIAFGPRWATADRPGAVPTGVEVGAVAERRAGAMDAPAADRRAVEAPSPGAVGAGELIVEVVDASGLPIVDAAVHIAGEAVHSGRSDAAGRVVFEARAGGGQLLVVGAGRVPVVRELEELSGRVDVRLGGGAVVAGQVVQLGAVRPEPVGLVLSGTTPFVAGTLRDELSPFWPGQRFDVWADASVEVRVDTSGAFSIAGLPRSWSGRIRTPFGSPWAMRPHGSNLDCVDFRAAELPAPRTGIVLELVRLPTVRGRVVWSDGEPVGEASLVLWARFSDGETLPAMSCSVAGDGRFELGLTSGGFARSRDFLDPARRPRLVSVEVWFRCAAARANGHRSWSDAEGSHSVDLGDLVLERAPIVDVLVLGPEDEPIEGARFDARGTVEPTGADGRGRIAVADAGQRVFAIGAPGQEVAEYTARSGAGTAEDPLTFRMRGANRLDVDVDLRGFRRADLRVEVQAAGTLFTMQAENEMWPSTLHQAAGSSATRSASWNPRDGVGSVPFELDETGRVRLVSVRPDLPVRVRLLDRLDAVLAEHSVRLPAAGRAERIHLEPGLVVCELRGRVAGEDGRPQAAHLGVASEGRTIYQSVEADGRFEMRLAATGAEATLELEALGHATVRRRLTLTRGVHEIDVTLRPGVTVAVRVVDATGRPVHVEPTLPDVAFSGSAESRLELGPGHHRFRRVPPGPTRALAEIAGRSFERTVEVGVEDEVVLAVPAVAQVTVAVPSEGPARGWDLELNQVGTELRVASYARPGRSGPPLVLWPGTWEVVVTPRGVAGAEPVRARWELSAGPSERALPVRTR